MISKNYQLRDSFVDWLRSKGLKDKTLKNYLEYYDKFHAEEFNQTSVNNFIEKKYNNPNSRAFLKNFKQFMISHRDELNLDTERLAQIQTIEIQKQTGRVKQRIITPLKEYDVGQIADKMTRKRDKIMLMLTFYCGLRAGELIKIRVKDFNFTDWKADMNQPGELRVFGKGDKEGIAIVPPQYMQSVRDYINATFPEIYSNQRVFEIKRSRWSMILKSCAAKAGYPDVHPHLLRHSFATMMLNNNADIVTIQRLMRHSSLSSTQIYLHLDQDKLKRDYMKAFHKNQ